MRKIFNWVIAATLFCGASVLTSCNENTDNPVKPDEPVVSPERQTFEKALSMTLQESAELIRFEALKQGMGDVGEFLLGLDEEALKNQVLELIPEILANTTQVKMDELSEADLKAVSAALKERFKLTDEELKAIPFFVLIDAYNVLGTKKLSFKDGKCTIGESDGFCIESTNKEGKTTSITLKFKKEHDGVRFFVTRLLDVTPIGIQLPSELDITVSTANGLEMDGSITLDSNAPSKYITFKSGLWGGLGILNADFAGRSETVKALVVHDIDRSFNIGVSLDMDGAEKASIAIQGMNSPYSTEYINSDELKSLRDYGAFFSAAYDALKSINGKTVDDVEFALGGKLVCNAKVDDVAACLLALGKIRQMHGTQPGFEAVDEYTQILNKYFHYTVGIKDTDITAKGSLVTIMKNLDKEEYQPGVALQFEGEKEPMVLLERMTEQDKANYKKIMNSVQDLTKSGALMIQMIKQKFSSFKGIKLS